MKYRDAFAIAEEMIQRVTNDTSETDKVMQEVCSSIGIDRITDIDKPAETIFSDALVERGGSFKLIGRALNIKISLAKMKSS